MASQATVFLPSQTHPILIRFIKSLRLSEDLTLFRLSVVKPENFTFLPGQYLSLQLTDNQGNTVERPLSIASAPDGLPVLELLIKMHPTGIVSPFFASLNPGAIITCTGAYGEFHEASSDTWQHFIASHSGVAPLRSRILNLAQNNPPPMSLYAELPEPGIHFFKNEFQDCTRTTSVFHLQLQPYLENPDRTILDQHLETLVPMSGTWNICGGKSFIADIQSRLLHRGVPQTNIRTEG